MSALFNEDLKFNGKFVKLKRTAFWVDHFNRWTKKQIVKIADVRIYVDHNLLSKKEVKGLYKGLHERPEAQIIQTVIEPTDKVVEIGVGFGLTSILCAKIVGPQNIICYEANDELEEYVAKNAALNEMTLNVHFQPVTKEGGECTFYRTETLIGSGTAKTSFEQRETIKKSVALSDILKEHRPNALIVDVEGAEVELLTESLDGVDKLLIEVHPHKASNKGLSNMLRCILDQGFVQIHELTDGHSLFFLRNKI